MAQRLDPVEPTVKTEASSSTTDTPPSPEIRSGIPTGKLKNKREKTKGEHVHCGRWPRIKCGLFCKSGNACMLGKSPLSKKVTKS
jgi:hypothetical protein